MVQRSGATHIQRGSTFCGARLRTGTPRARGNLVDDCVSRRPRAEIARQCSIGHFCPGIHRCCRQPEKPRGGQRWFFAAQLVDWGFFAARAGGCEKAAGRSCGQRYGGRWIFIKCPYTHSLIGAGIWALSMPALVVGLERRSLFAGLLGGPGGAVANKKKTKNKKKNKMAARLGWCMCLKI